MKKIVAAVISTVVASAAICGMAGCSGTSGDGKVKLTLWGSLEQQPMLNEMIAEFKQANPDTDYEISLGICTSANAYAQIRTDVSAGADVYEFANDQLINRYKAGALAKLGSAVAASVTESNSADSVAQAKVGDSVYA